MMSVNYVSNANVINFCDLSLDRAAMNSIIHENKHIGLSDPELEAHLEQGSYQKVLVALWSERDRTRRVEWLESKEGGLHPVLMFELAVAKFVKTPTIETVNKVSIPLMKAADFRVQQDSQCSKEPSVKYGDASARMCLIYQTRLNQRIQASLNTSLEKILSENQNLRVAAIRKKALETAQLCLSGALPSPNWVGWHGVNACMTGVLDMYPDNEHKQIRDRFAQDVLRALEAGSL
ncbi:MAG: hypothetical protein Q8L98_03330 [Chlamydiales bacterium]|nr:hypothetical protein [Chlamydiales bacterium]